MALLNVQKLNKSFQSGTNKLHVIKDLNLEVERGDLVALTGTSGSGKSTLLNLIGSMDIPDSGSIKILGIDIVGKDESELTEFRLKHIGFIFQFHYLLPEFTARENIAIPAMIAGNTRKDAMKKALDILEPALVGGEARQAVGTIVLGTVEGDLHEIGKTLVGTMLAANGFEVVDLGVDKSASEFIDAVKESGANLVGASALLTTTMLRQKDLIETLKEAGLRERVMVMVGGAPVTERYANEIGADGYAADAISAVDLAIRLVGPLPNKPLAETGGIPTYAVLLPPFESLQT